MTDHPQAARAADARPAFADWSSIFLDELAISSNIRASAAKAGVSTSEVYHARRKHAKFAREWQLALCEGYDALELNMLYRLRTGELKPPSGAKRATRTWDLATGLRLLMAHRESVATERAARTEQSPAQALRSLNAKLGRMRKQALASGKDVWAVPGDDR